MTFQDLALFHTLNYSDMALGPSIAIGTTLSPIFLVIYYVKSLPRGCGLLLQGLIAIYDVSNPFCGVLLLEHVKRLLKIL